MKFLVPLLFPSAFLPPSHLPMTLACIFIFLNMKVGNIYIVL